MGYALPGAIGVAIANPGRQVVCFEGDGSIAQSLSEFSMLKEKSLNLKVFVLANRGYASIRATQTRFTGGSYVGCDMESGLHLPA